MSLRDPAAAVVLAVLAVVYVVYVLVPLVADWWARRRHRRP